jgi:ADP-ribosylglycohydrolase
MTLFTAEGVMRAWVRQTLRGLCSPPDVIAFAYQRWLYTQGQSHALQHFLDGWLIGHRDLFSRRAPGNTCLSGLRSMKNSSDRPANKSKGCGGVMRVAPIGMFYASLVGAHKEQSELRAGYLKQAFDLACDAAAITHGHPTGQLASGVFAAVVMQLLLGIRLPQAIVSVMPLLAERPGHDETTSAVRAAVRLAKQNPNDYQALGSLGEGWIAEEALSMALYCALSARGFRAGLELAVNHSGDSDSTGSMAGQLLGAIHGLSEIPASWLEPLELREVIDAMADDLATVMEWRLDDTEAQEEGDFYFSRYPGA